MQAQVNEIFGCTNPAADSHKGSADIGGRLASDGTKAEDSGFDTEHFGETEPDDDKTHDEQARATQENMTGDANGVVNRGGTAPSYAPKDAITATVGTGSALTSGYDITVQAQDILEVDMITGCLAGSGIFSAGVGVSIGVLYSNVVATVEEGAVLSAGGSINVLAIAGIEQLTGSPGRQQAKKNELYNTADTTSEDGTSEYNLSDYSVRIITVSVGAALVGIGVAVSAIMMYTETHAIMAGDVISAGCVNVRAESCFGSVLALTLGVSVGLCAISGSVALVIYEANVEACICASADISGVGAVNVTTFSDTTAAAIAAALGVGVAAVNAACAIAINHTRVDTFIGQGVRCAAGSVYLESNVYTGAKALILSIAVGGVAVSATLALAILKPVVLTYIGTTPYAGALAHASGSGGSVTATGGVTVINAVTGDAHAMGLSVAGGLVALNGTVALAFNNVTGYAAINKTSVSADDIEVLAAMDGDSTVKALALTVGAVAGGLIVAIATVATDNRAMIDITGSTVLASGTIQVSAGGSGGQRYFSTALADVKTASLGLAALSVNVAFTVNNASNIAIVQGQSGTMTAGGLEIRANGWTQTTTKISGIDAGALTIAISVSLAILQSHQEATLCGFGNYTLGSLIIESRQNIGKTNGYDAEAIIKSGGGALASVSGQIGLVIANVSGIASAGAAHLNVTGRIEVLSFGRSNAYVSISDASPVNGISIGVMYGAAYGSGVFQALLGSDGGHIDAQGIDVITEYTASAISDINPASCGFSVSLVTVNGNIAWAQILTIAEAAIVGSGVVTSSHAVTVRATGIVYAYAVVHGVSVSVSAVNIAVNLAYAILAAAQSAYIDGASVVTTGAGDNGNVTVLSEYNKNAIAGALAVTGANGGDDVSLSLLGVSINEAGAYSRSTSKAYIKGASTDISGDLTIKSDATSIAYSDIGLPEVSISLINITTTDTTAEAAGTYEAYIDSTGSAGDIKAGSISVIMVQITEGIAVTGSNGGVSVSLVNVKSNEAKASAKSEARAYIKGSGNVAADGGILVSANGATSAISRVKEATFSVSAVNIATNKTGSSVLAVQEAYIDAAGSITAGGAIAILSEIADSSAYAKTGPSASGVSLSLISGTSHEAAALSQSVNAAYIGGAAITAASLSVTANTTSFSRAFAKTSLAVGLMNLGSLSALAYSMDTVIVKIAEDTRITVTGGIAVSATGDTTAVADCDTPGSISLLSSHAAVSNAFVGYGTMPQKVSIEIGDGCVISAGGDIDIAAANVGHATSNIQSGLGISGISLDVQDIVTGTSSIYDTRVIIGSGVTLAAGGDIRISAEDSPYARTEVNSTSFSVLELPKGVSAYSNISQHVATVIGTDCVIRAAEDIDITADSNDVAVAIARQNGGSAIVAGNLYASVVVERFVDVSVGDGTDIYSEFGDILIQSQGGLEDDVAALSICQNGGLLTGGSSMDLVTVVSMVHTVVGHGVHITGDVGSVSILSRVGCYVYATGVLSGGGAISVPIAYGMMILDLTAVVDIGMGEDNGYGITDITGQYVTIESRLVNLDVTSRQEAYSVSAISYAIAIASLGFGLIIEVNIDDARICGNKTLLILADAKPDALSGRKNIWLYALAYSATPLGYVTSQIVTHGANINNVIKNWHTAVNIYGNVKIYGMDIRIDFDRGIPIEYIPILVIGSPGSKTMTLSLSLCWENSGVFVNPAVVFYIGGASAGITILISEDHSVTGYGNAEGANLWTVDEANGIVKINKTIKNEAAGSLDVGGLLSGNTIYMNTTTPEVNIINRSDLDVYVAGVDVGSENLVYPNISAYFGSTYTVVRSPEEIVPVINIVSFGATDVYLGSFGTMLGGIVLNPEGITNIVWEGEQNGSLYAGTAQMDAYQVAALWTHELNIVNAKNVGQDENHRFNAYLTIADGVAPVYAIQAMGDVYSEMALAEINVVAALPAAVDDSPIGMDYVLDGISAGGMLDVFMPYPVRVWMLKGAQAAYLIAPGCLQYINDTYTSDDPVNINDIARYATALDGDDNPIAYELPNGVIFYTDAEGTVTRVVSGGETYALDNYEYALEGGHLVVTLLAEGVKIDLYTGVLTVTGTDPDIDDETFDLFLGYAYDPSMESYDDGWQIAQMAHGEYAGFETRALLFNMLTGETMEVKDSRLVSSWGGQDYYLVYTNVEGDNPLATAADIAGQVFYTVVLSSADGSLMGVIRSRRSFTSTEESCNSWEVVSTEIYDTFILSRVEVTYTEDSFTRVSGYRLVWHALYDRYDFYDPDTHEFTFTEFEYVYGSAETRLEKYNEATATWERVTLTDAGDDYYAYDDNDMEYLLINVTFRDVVMLGDGSPADITVNWSKINVFEPIPLQTQTVTNNDGGEYTYRYAQIDMGGEAVAVVYEHDEAVFYDADGKEHHIEIDNYPVPDSINTSEAYQAYMQNNVHGGTITLSEGDSITLYLCWYRNNQISGFRIADDMFITRQGTVCFDFDGTDAYFEDGVTYNGYLRGFYSPAISIDNRNYTAMGIDIAQADIEMASGAYHFESLSEDVARDCRGNYYAYDGAAWVLAQTETMDGDLLIRLDGELKLTIGERDGVLYHILPSGVGIGEDGSVRLFAEVASDNIKVIEISGSDTMVGYIEGVGGVIITLEDPASSLKDKWDNDTVNICSAGCIMFVTDNPDGAIGEADNFLDIMTPAPCFKNRQGAAVLATDTYINVFGDTIRINNCDPLTIDSATVVVNALGGSISGSDLYVTDASTVDMNALTDIMFDNVTVDLLSDLALTAGNDIIINDKFAVNDSTVGLEAAAGDAEIATVEIGGSAVTITAGGLITVTAFAADNGDVDLDADGDVFIGEFTVESGSTVGIISGGGFTSDTWSVSDSDVDLEADDAVGIGEFTAESGSIVNITAGGGYSSDTWTASGSTVRIAAGSGISISDVDIEDSTASMTAGGDIELNIFRGSDSDISFVSTGGGICAADGESYIKITGTGSALTMSALADIGSADVHIRMDLPAEVVLHILHVDDYYIDALEIPVSDPPADPVYEGVDETGNPVTNDGEIPNEYVGSIDAETVTIDYDSLTAEQWAQRLMCAMTREEWLALVAEGSVGDLILAGSIDAELLSEYLFDDTITPGALTAMLSVPVGTPEWQATLDWLAATEAALRALLASTEGMTPDDINTAVITDDMAEALLALFITNNVVGEVDPTLVLTTEEIAQLAAKIAENLAAQATATLSAVDNEARAFNVLVGESTGSAWVTNEGDINITQQMGSMTVGLIDSARGDVSLTALDASEGDIHSAATGATHIEARNIVLSAAGSIGLVIDEISNRFVAVYNILDTRFAISNTGTPEAPVIIGRLESDVRYDWLRIWDCDEATRLDAAAVGSIDIAEARGDLGIGIISAGGAVTLAAEFGIYDTTDSGKDITGTSLAMTASQGSIGTAARYIDTKISGAITATAQGDIFVTDTGDMTMTADSLTGQVSTETEDDMILRNTAGDLRLGIVIAGGFAAIMSAGSIIEGDRYGAAATIMADGMALTATGDIGTPENPLEVDTGGGTLRVEAAALYLAEISGDLNIESVITADDCSITAQGSIFGASGTEFNDALDAQLAADEAQSAATLAQTKATVLQDYANRLREETGAEDAAAQAEADAAQAIAYALQAAADTAQVHADALLAVTTGAGVTIQAGGDLTLAADGGIELSIRVAGSVTAAAGGGIYMACADGVRIASITAGGDVEIIATGGSIVQAYAAIAPSITGGNVALYALDGYDVGEAVNPLYLNARSISAIGENVYIRSFGAIAVNRVTAEGEIVLTAGGGIAAGQTGTNMTAGRVTLTADGDIGAAGTPLVVNTGNLSISGKDIFIESNSGNLIIAGIKGDKIEIIAHGNVQGKNIRGSKVTIQAFGSVGILEDPLVLRARKVNITSEKGLVYYINVYPFPPTLEEWQEKPLGAYYTDVFVISMPFIVETGCEQRVMALYIAIGLNEEGGMEVIGLWSGNADEDGVTSVLQALFSRGVAQIDTLFIFVQGAVEYADDMPLINAMQDNTLLWVIGSGLEIAPDDYDELMGRAVRRICSGNI